MMDNVAYYIKPVIEEIQNLKGITFLIAVEITVAIFLILLVLLILEKRAKI